MITTGDGVRWEPNSLRPNNCATPSGDNVMRRCSPCVKTRDNTLANKPRVMDEANWDMEPVIAESKATAANGKSTHMFGTLVDCSSIDAEILRLD